jgi:uncharacterized membrane protein YdcZ (DUF606 family)
MPIAERTAGVVAAMAALRTGDVRWWHCTGGACGALVAASRA